MTWVQLVKNQNKSYMKHHYESLNLEEGASQDEIQVAYDKLSKELDPAKNDNQDFFIEEYKKVQEAYKALSQSSILKNNDSSKRSLASNRDESSSSSNSSGSFTVTISPEKIEELKNKIKLLEELFDTSMSMSHSNSSTRDTYKKYYNTNTRNIIQNMFKDDLEKYGYQF